MQQQGEKKKKWTLANANYVVAILAETNLLLIAQQHNVCVWVSLCVPCNQPSPCVTVCLCLCAGAGEEKKNSERRHQCLSSDHSHYIISAWVTNNTDSVSTLSVENKDQHVQGEFPKACASLGHELKAIIELYVNGCFISSLLKIPPVFLKLKVLLVLLCILDQSFDFVTCCMTKTALSCWTRSWWSNTLWHRAVAGFYR